VRRDDQVVLAGHVDRVSGADAVGRQCAQGVLLGVRQHRPTGVLGDVRSLGLERRALVAAGKLVVVHHEPTAALRHVVELLAVGDDRDGAGLLDLPVLALRVLEHRAHWHERDVGVGLGRALVVLVAGEAALGRVGVRHRVVARDQRRVTCGACGSESSGVVAGFFASCVTFTECGRK
jgi:hypothetical protein